MYYEIKEVAPDCPFTKECHAYAICHCNVDITGQCNRNVAYEKQINWIKSEVKDENKG